MSPASILLVLPLPAYQVGDRIYLDEQACYGLDLWLEHFSTIVLACPTLTCDQPPSAIRPIDTITSPGRLAFEALPTAYTPLTFAIHLYPTACRLSEMINRSMYLHFAIGGFWGDWGAVSAIISNRKRRPFAVWTDRVESGVIAFQSSTRSGLSRLYYSLTAKLAAWLERFVISRSYVGLFNGMDCYRAYESFCNNPQLVANFNFPKGTHVSDSELSSRLAELDGRRIRLVYVGRAHKDKGIYDWIDTISKVGDSCSATWFGDGPELENARAMVAARNLGDKIEFVGSAPHDVILAQLKDYDAFVFCHKTQESPRCLIEALACGLPLVGYASDYANDLILENAGGILTPIDDTAQLADSLQRLMKDRGRLKQLSRAAARDGKRFHSEATFRHRSELIKLIPATL